MIDSDLDEQDPHSLELLRTIEFGIAVQNFMDGPVFARMKVDAEEEAASLAEEMVNLDPDVEADRAQMRTIRHRMGVLNHWRDLFDAYVAEGKSAEAMYQEQDSQ